MTFEDAARSAASAITARPAGTRWLLACDVDADGLAAGAVMAQALRRIGHRFTVRASRDKSAAGMRALFGEAWDGLILLDKGSAHLCLLADLSVSASPDAPRPVVVVDHHNVETPPPPGVTLLNPRAEGLDGSREASAATTAAALALALCGDAALAWAPTALAGAKGDLQDETGWCGWNLELASRARKAGHLGSALRPALQGSDVAVAISRMQPPLPGLGDADAAARLFEGLGIERDADADALGPEARTRLVSALLLRQLAAGQASADPRSLLAEVDRHEALGASLAEATRTADACGREGQAATGIAYLMGDKSAKAEAAACLAVYSAKLSHATQALRTSGFGARTAMQVAWTEEASYSGLVAGRGMDEVASDHRRPVLILAHRLDGLVQASTRGTHAQVAAGMDLGRACAAAAQAAGGEGGGHPVAAGAVVPEDNVAGFVAALDRELLDQGYVARLA